MNQFLISLDNQIKLKEFSYLSGNILTLKFKDNEIEFISKNKFFTLLSQVYFNLHGITLQNSRVASGKVIKNWNFDINKLSPLSVCESSTEPPFKSLYIPYPRISITKNLKRVASILGLLMGMIIILLTCNLNLIFFKFGYDN
jgi:hypothetical protein